MCFICYRSQALLDAPLFTVDGDNITDVSMQRFIYYRSQALLDAPLFTVEGGKAKVSVSKMRPGMILQTNTAWRARNCLILQQASTPLISTFLLIRLCTSMHTSNDLRDHHAPATK